MIYWALELCSTTPLQPAANGAGVCFAIWRTQSRTSVGRTRTMRRLTKHDADTSGTLSRFGLRHTVWNYPAAAASLCLTTTITSLQFFGSYYTFRIPPFQLWWFCAGGSGTSRTPLHVRWNECERRKTQLLMAQHSPQGLTSCGSASDSVNGPPLGA